VKKIQVPVLGGLRKKVNINGGTNIAGYDSLSLAELAGLLGIVPAAATLPNTIAKVSPPFLTVGPGLEGGGALIGNVSLRLDLGTLPGGSDIYGDTGEDVGMMLSQPGVTGPQGPRGFTMIGLDGDDGQDGSPGPAGAAGSAGATGPAGAAGPPLWFEADSGEDPLQIQGPTGAAGAAGAAGVAGAIGPALWREGDDGEDYPARDIPGMGDSNTWSAVNNFLNLMVQGQPYVAPRQWVPDGDHQEEMPFSPPFPVNILAAGTFTATLTGVTASTTGTGIWVKISIGNTGVVVLWIPSLVGTSNSTAATVSGLPSAIQTSFAQNLFCLTENAGTPGFSLIQVPAASSAITLFNGVPPSSTFTASGSKGVPDGCVLVYQL
jgi:hypothetical protein